MSLEAAGRPPHPKLVLALSALGPGLGHLALGRPLRALGFAFFTLLFAVLTARISAPDRSFIGQHAGGFFIWALSIPDAYRAASLRRALWRRDTLR